MKFKCLRCLSLILLIFLFSTFTIFYTHITPRKTITNPQIRRRKPKAPPKTSTTVAEPPRTEPPRTEPPRTEPPRTEPPLQLQLPLTSGAYQAMSQLGLKSHQCPFLVKTGIEKTEHQKCFTSETCNSNEFCHPELRVCSRICKTPQTDVSPNDMVPHENDVFIVSFPKSGSTWLRHLIANVNQYMLSLNHGNAEPPEKPSTFEQVDDLIPFLEDKASGNIHDLFTSTKTNSIFPRMFKTHQPWQCDGPPCRGWVADRQAKTQCKCPMCASKYKRVIYIIRDGRATMYSYYHFQKDLRLRGRTKSFDLFLRYRKRRYPGVSWADHVRTWLAAPNVDILWVKYEDLKKQPNIELLKVMKFLNVDVNNDAIQDALNWSIKASSRDSMRKTERESGAGLFTKKYRRSYNNFKMVHKGKGKWKDYFIKNGVTDNQEWWDKHFGYISRCFDY